MVENPQIARENANNEIILDAPSIGVPWRILVFSIILFALSLFIVFGLKFGISNYYDSRIETLDTSIDTLSQEVGQEEQKDFAIFYSQLVNLKKVLGDHKFSVNTLSFLEKYTLPSVSFTQASISSDEEKVELEGKTSSLKKLIEQLSVFDEADGLRTKAIVESVAFNPDGGVGFTLSLFFKDEVFSRL